MSKKEVAVKEQPLPPSALSYDFDGFDDLPRAENSDFDIPRLTLIQPTSQMDGEPGDLIDSIDNSKLIGLGDKLSFVPVWFMKDYAITEVETKKWRRNEIKSAGNSHFSVFDNRIGTDPDGTEVQRAERLNLFLVREQALAEDLPRVYRMVIKPSSFKEAKKFLSEWDIQIRSRLCPFSFVWSITPKLIKNEKGKFVVLEFTKVMDQNKQRQITAEQFAKVNFWVKTLMANKDKVEQHSGPDDESESAQRPPKDFEKGQLNY